MRIVVTGASGFFGRNLLPILQKIYGQRNVIGLSSKDYDLMDLKQVDKMFKEKRPQVLIHLAAYSGGIGVNQAYPADFFYRNILLAVPVFKVAMQYGIRKMIYPIGGCSYPAKAISPIDENQMWKGFPQEESAGYSLAKMMGLAASNCYRQQYNFNSAVIIPGNLYGKYDNFRPDEAHVIPALIRRLYEAKVNGAEEVMVWGTGCPERDFVYIEDVAATIPFFIENYNESGPVNISSGTRTSIKQLAEAISELVGYSGNIVWDISKPDGQMIKIYDISRMKELGLNCPTPLSTGLATTVDWFVYNYQNQKEELRL